MDITVVGPFVNPVWAAADEKMRKHQDRWAYSINGHTFTHPTFEGAQLMMGQPEKHAEVIGYFPKD